MQKEQVWTDLSLSSPPLERKKNESSTCYKKPWKISKVLTKSDIGRLSRLLLRADEVEKFMLPVLGLHAQREVQNGTGSPVSVWDVDTMSMHQLILKRWKSSGNFVLNGGWSRDFVRRRGLVKGDQIRLLWDSFKRCFHFSVLKPLHCPTVS